MWVISKAGLIQRPLSKVLEKGGPYPQVILPQFGGYWIEDVEAPAGTPSSSESSFCEEEDGGEGMSPGGGYSYRLECNSTARAYRKHFLGKVSVAASISACVYHGESVPENLSAFYIPAGAHELLLHWQQHRQPHHVTETRRGWGSGVPTHHAQVGGCKQMPTIIGISVGSYSLLIGLLLKY